MAMFAYILVLIQMLQQQFFKMDIETEQLKIDRLNSILDAIKHFETKIKLHKSNLKQIKGNFPVLINKINNDIDTCERIIIKLQLKFQKLFKNE